jgi:SAM-dependent methyltransferase
MFKDLVQQARKPVLFTKGTANFWDDPHISKYMLEAHLDPTWDAASRKPETIDRTVEWLTNYLPSQAAILDLGCGPGLYAERLARLGHRVTGVDFSRRSIEYARGTARDKGLSIDYVYQNYLEIDYHEAFDLVILIYCDLGALVDVDRDLLLQKVYTALKPGGVFIFDVFTEEFGSSVEEKQSWKINADGFWAASPHVVLSQDYHYPEQKVLLRQDIVLRDDGTHDVYRTYDHYYAEPDLTQLLDSFRFANHRFAYDVIGEANFASQKVVFVATSKQK